MELDDIKPDEPILMTVRLQRLFKVAGCSPTSCHACGDTIKVGETFKLVTHTKRGAAETDEMCCHKCGVIELTSRDIKALAAPIRRFSIGTITDPDALKDINNQNAQRRGEWGGYSRPSKKV